MAKTEWAQKVDDAFQRVVDNLEGARRRGETISSTAEVNRVIGTYLYPGVALGKMGELDFDRQPTIPEERRALALQKRFSRRLDKMGLPKPPDTLLTKI